MSVALETHPQVHLTRATHWGLHPLGPPPWPTRRRPERGGPGSQQPPGGLSREMHGAGRDVRGPGKVLVGAFHQGHLMWTADHDGSGRGRAPVARSCFGRHIGGLRRRPTVGKKFGQTLLRQVRYGCQNVAQVREGIVSITLATRHHAEQHRLVLPPFSLPVNNQFLRPIAMVFMRCSDTLLSIDRYPEVV